MLAILLILTLTIPTFNASTNSNKLKELTKEQQKLKDEIEKKAQDISDAQIEIESLNATMESNQAEINQLNSQITAKQKELNDQMSDFKSTLEVMQRLENSNALVSYVANDNNDNFLLKFKNIMMLSKTMDTNIQDVTADIDSINQALDVSESYKAQNKSNQAKAQALVTEQQNTEAQLREQLNDVDGDVAAVTEQISLEEAAKLQKQQQAKIEKEAKKAIADANKDAGNNSAETKTNEQPAIATTPEEEPKVEEEKTTPEKEPEVEEVEPEEPEPSSSQYPSDGNVSAYKNQLLGAAGISSSDLKYVDYIISKESSWNYLISNQYSGAYGLCQALPGSKMASSGGDWATNPETQMKWCNTYAVSRYGSWQGAYNFWLKNNWW